MPFVVFLFFNISFCLAPVPSEEVDFVGVWACMRTVQCTPGAHWVA